MNYPTTSIYPPFVQDATPVTPAAATVRPIPSVVLPPVERVGRFEQVDRDQLLRVLTRAAAAEDSRIASESSWWRQSVEAEQVAVARLREQRAEVA